MDRLPQLPSSIPAGSAGGARECSREQLVDLGCSEQQIGRLLSAKQVVSVFLKACPYSLKLEHEKRIYDTLKDLQGHCIPELIGHGLFTTDQQQQQKRYVLVMEHAGSRVTAQDLGEPGVLDEIFDKLAQIHALNVVLVDLKEAHLRRCSRTQGGIMFIDFDLSVDTTATEEYTAGYTKVRGYVNYPNKMATGDYAGTPFFGSIDLLLGLRPSPRCDYESLYYLVSLLFDHSFFFRNSAAWTGMGEDAMTNAEVILSRKVDHIMTHPELLAAIMDNDCARLRLLIEAETRPLQPSKPDSNQSSPINPCPATMWIDSSSQSSSPSSSLPHTQPSASAMGTTAETAVETQKQQLLDKFSSECENLLSSTKSLEASAKDLMALGSTCIELDVGQELSTQGHKAVCQLPEYLELTASATTTTTKTTMSGGDDSKTKQEGGREVAIGIFSSVNLCRKPGMRALPLEKMTRLTCPLPAIKLAVGEIKVSWRDSEMMDAVKTKISQLETALLATSSLLGAAASHHHPLSVLTLGLHGVVSVTSMQELGDVEMDDITQYLRDFRPWFPRVWLLAIAERFFIHKSDNLYKNKVLAAGAGVAFSRYLRCLSRPAKIVSDQDEIIARIMAICAYYGKKMGVRWRAQLEVFLQKAILAASTAEQRDLILQMYETKMMRPEDEELFFALVVAHAGLPDTVPLAEMSRGEVKGDDPLFVYLRSRVPNKSVEILQACVRVLNDEGIDAPEDVRSLWSEAELAELTTLPPWTLRALHALLKGEPPKTT